MARQPIAGQPDLLDWTPPQPIAAFEPASVRAVTLSARVSQAVAQVLRDAGMERERVAAEMGRYLGQPVSPAMLDAYASEARAQHNISAVRLAALIWATGDRRPLQMLAETGGWAVIERRYLPVIELAALGEHEDALQRRRRELRAMARLEGAL